MAIPDIDPLISVGPSTDVWRVVSRGIPSFVVPGLSLMMNDNSVGWKRPSVCHPTWSASTNNDNNNDDIIRKETKKGKLET